MAGFSSSSWASYLTAPAKPQKRFLVGGNWKCYGTTASTNKLVAMLNGCGAIPAHVEVVVAPPAPYLGIRSTLRADVATSGQNCSKEGKEGAYTGETAPSMLTDLGATWVILGHSERRHGWHGETSADVAAKTKVALDAGLSVMVCIGETLEERESGRLEAVVLGEHMGALKGKFTPLEWKRIAIAYEPVWAIGTGKVATPEIAQSVHASIRQWMAANESPLVAADVRIMDCLPGGECVMAAPDVPSFPGKCGRAS